MPSTPNIPSTRSLNDRCGLMFHEFLWWIRLGCLKQPYCWFSLYLESIPIKWHWPRHGRNKNKRSCTLYCMNTKRFFWNHLPLVSKSLPGPTRFQLQMVQIHHDTCLNPPLFFTQNHSCLSVNHSCTITNAPHNHLCLNLIINELLDDWEIFCMQLLH